MRGPVTRATPKEIIAEENIEAVLTIGRYKSVLPRRFVMCVKRLKINIILKNLKSRHVNITSCNSL